MRQVREITILHDGDCGLCVYAKWWMTKQAALVRMRFIETGSEDARRLYPRIPVGELAVVADTGDVWLGDRAWVVCLWALRDFRDLACRLTSPALWSLSREAFAAVSRNRRAVSRLLKLPDSREMERQLRTVNVIRCQNELK